MPRSAAVVVQNQFSKGLITEASGLNFPEDACSDTYDCLFSKTGEVRRRLGFEYETSYALNAIGASVEDKAISEYIWEGVANIGTLFFAVQQIGNILYFFETSNSTGLSANRKSFTVDLSTHAVTGAPLPAALPCSFSNGNGNLFVLHHYCQPFYIVYDPDTDTISDTSIDLLIRDFAGIDDGQDIELRSAILTTIHKYNLYNQGWYISANCGSEGVQNVLSNWHSHRSDYPSNADIWWLFKDSNSLFEESQFDRFFNGNTPAPKGHYLFNPFYQDRSAASGIAGLTVTSSNYFRPSVGAFYAGRVFYGGTDYKDFSSKIYFSKIIEADTEYGHCYQTNDPTSENNSDLLPSDGGVIVIPDLGSLVRLFRYGNDLIIFSSNGVWSLGGSQGVGFTANDYAIKKVSSVTALGAFSFVDLEGAICWWNADGIYVLQMDPLQGTVTVQSLTDQTIKTFVQAIPSTNIEFIKASYNSATKTVQWLARTTAATTVAERYQYDIVLNYLTLTQAFFPWTISAGPAISGIFTTKGFGVSRVTANVVDNAGNTVVDAAGNTVVVTAITSSSLTSSFRYTTIVPGYSLTYSQEKDTGYKDWITYAGGVDFESYFVTGYKVHGQGQRKFQGNWLDIFSETESNSSAYVQYIWDYATSGNSGRYSVPEQLYLARANTSITPRRLKLRGQGLVLQLKYYSSTGKPFNIVGWSMFETGNQLP